jgi:aminoglycoside phosphotransferase (APT) family kinase protein
MTVEVQALEEMLRSFVPGGKRVRVSEVTPLLGGFSAETARVRAACEIGDGMRSLDVVLRQAPADGILAPYDLERESRILRALQDSPVPVPHVVGCDPVGQFLGQPCLVTEFVPGEPLWFFGQVTATDDERLPAYFAMLATIHTIDWAGLGLDFLDDPAGPVQVELKRCQARLEYHGGPGATEREMLAWLSSTMPTDGQKALLHGDPNPANYLFAGSQVAAVLDWELAVLGDPRLDLGFYAAGQSVFGVIWGLDAKAFVRGYAAANPNVNLQHLDYFEAVGLYRFATFLRAAERQRGITVTELQRRLSQRFEQIASG